MKSNRGITLTSLVVYIIGLIIVISLMANVSGYFFKNVNETTLSQNADEQYSKFLSYITKDVNSDNLTYVKSGVDGKDCIIFKFTDGAEHQYINQDEKIYYINVENRNEKKIVLCEKVSSQNAFSYANKKIDVNFNISDSNFGTTLSVNIK